MGVGAARALFTVARRAVFAAVAPLRALLALFLTDFAVVCRAALVDRLVLFVDCLLIITI